MIALGLHGSFSSNTNLMWVLSFLNFSTWFRLSLTKRSKNSGLITQKSWHSQISSMTKEFYTNYLALKGHNRIFCRKKTPSFVECSTSSLFPISGSNCFFVRLCSHCHSFNQQDTISLDWQPDFIWAFISQTSRLCFSQSLWLFDICLNFDSSLIQVSSMGSNMCLHRLS